MTTASKPKGTPVAINDVDTLTLLATTKAVAIQPEFGVQIYKNRPSIATMNNHLPFVWRVNYLHEVPSPEMPEIAHEKARQILEKNLSRAGLWKRP
jgi:hypothetical protein